jgi:hypothetical protein
VYNLGHGGNVGSVTERDGAGRGDDAGQWRRDRRNENANRRRMYSAALVPSVRADDGVVFSVNDTGTVARITVPSVGDGQPLLE